MGKTTVARLTRLALALATLVGGLVLVDRLLVSAAQAPAQIAVHVPAPGQVLEEDASITVTVVLTGQAIYGYQFIVAYDPALVEAQAAGFDSAFVRADFSPALWSASIDAASGQIRFAATQTRPALPVTGSGAVAWIRFRGRAAAILPAVASVDITDPRLSTADGERMTPAATPGAILVLPKAIVSGHVQLQGRSDYSGALVAALPASVSTVVGVDGRYTLTMVAGDIVLTVEMARYLDAERTLAAARGSNSQTTVRLLGGDANDDDVIDILDLGIVAGRYGLVVDPASERADINVDGVVDISDLGLVAGNYGLTSPVPWP
jgi:hypothetical protein